MIHAYNQIFVDTADENKSNASQNVVWRIGDCLMRQREHQHLINIASKTTNKFEENNI